MAHSTSDSLKTAGNSAQNGSTTVTVSSGNGSEPAPVDPDKQVITDEVMHCTFSINCGTILNNMDKCNEDKRELVPGDGWVLSPVSVAFHSGESVFDVLKSVCREYGIHLEFENTPVYNSAYIEGINNIYEFDVGSLSGWMFKVNGWFPNYGSSRYQLKDGDTVEWVFTCDLGYDVGGGYAGGN